MTVSTPSGRAPVSAIVIFRNERANLEQCLPRLGWCDELIAIDMASTDGSRAVAERYADRLFSVDPYPIAEPTRVAAMRLARHDWVLMVDPDEWYPEPLSSQLMAACRAPQGVGAFTLPIRYYVKGQRLDTTLWGGLKFKRTLMHRERCEALPLCNRINRLLPGFRDHRLPEIDGVHIEHHWTDSMRSLIHRHIVRYPVLEAKAMLADGQTFSLRRAIVEPLRQFKICFKDFDGWRGDVRGWVLSGMYLVYCLLSEWLKLVYRGRVQPGERSTHARIPELIEHDLPHHRAELRTAA